jgi:hypothetical protein
MSIERATATASRVTDSTATDFLWARAVADRRRRSWLHAVRVDQLRDEHRVKHTVVAVGKRDETRWAEWPAQRQPPELSQEAFEPSRG